MRRLFLRCEQERAEVALNLVLFHRSIVIDLVGITLSIAVANLAGVCRGCSKAVANIGGIRIILCILTPGAVYQLKGCAARGNGFRDKGQIAIRHTGIRLGHSLLLRTLAILRNGGRQRRRIQRQLAGIPILGHFIEVDFESREDFGLIVGIGLTGYLLDHVLLVVDLLRLHGHIEVIIGLALVGEGAAVKKLDFLLRLHHVDLLGKPCVIRRIVDILWELHGAG